MTAQMLQSGIVIIYELSFAASIRRLARACAYVRRGPSVHPTNCNVEQPALWSTARSISASIPPLHVPLELNCSLPRLCNFHLHFWLLKRWFYLIPFSVTSIRLWNRMLEELGRLRSESRRIIRTRMAILCRGVGEVSFNSDFSFVSFAEPILKPLQPVHYHRISYISCFQFHSKLPS